MGVFEIAQGDCVGWGLMRAEDRSCVLEDRVQVLCFLQNRFAAVNIGYL